MSTSRRHLLGLAACIAFAQGTDLLSQAGSRSASPTITPVLHVVALQSPLIIEDVPQGAVIDLSTYKFLADRDAMNAVVEIRSTVTTTNYTEPNRTQNSQISVKLGIIDCQHKAQNGLIIRETVDSEITVRAVLNCRGTGVLLNGGHFHTANNFIRVGAILGHGGNGLLMQNLDRPDDTTFNVQGNHIEVGQVFANGASGVVAWKGAIANTIIAGPVEHNSIFGVCDRSEAPAQYKNNWILNGINANPKGDVCP